MKRKPLPDPLERLKASEALRRIIALHKELLLRAISRPEYSEATKDSLRLGGEAYIAGLMRGL